MQITILTWLWSQEGARCLYTVEHVNAWARAIRDNLHRYKDAVRIACVTDHEGLSTDIHRISPPRDFEHFQSAKWNVKQGLPQCYRRIAMFSPNAAQVFGEAFLCLDLDILITGNLDGLIDELLEHDFAIFRGTAATRPYNGGLVWLKAGARPKVYTEFTEENAHKASTQFLGSDQAWISYCLGRGEKTIGEANGVDNYCPRFVRENGGVEDFKPPVGLRILFFPGTVKAFHSTNKIWGGSSQDQRIIGIIKGQVPCRFVAYDDPKQWGRKLHNDHAFKLINKTRDAKPGDIVFVRLDQQGTQREISKEFILTLALKNIKTFPSATEALWYDDKVAQYEVLKDHMPDTWIHLSLEEALAAIETTNFPIISKSSDGASSSNVRILRTKEDAEQEARAAFGPGLLTNYDRRQHGYVYWQRIVPDNACDYRVVVAGPYVYGLVRHNAPGTIFASGSGRNYPMLFEDKREVLAANAALYLAEYVLNTKWMAFDIVFDEDGSPKVLEISSAWTLKSYKECPLFLHTFERTDGWGDQALNVAADIMQGIDPLKRYARYHDYTLRINCGLGKKGDVVHISDADARALARNRVIEYNEAQNESQTAD